LAGLALGAGVYRWQVPAVVETVASAPAASFVPLPDELEPLVQSIRLTGSVSARESASIRAPRLRVRSQLTLTELAEAGTNVTAGDVVARFESRELEDRVDDMQSNQVQALAALESARADILIQRESMRQELERAKAEYEKAKLELRKVEVLSEIQGQILRDAAAEAEAAWRQLQRESALQEEVFARRMRVEEIDVAEAKLRYERFARDLEQMTLRAPVSGLVVLEPMYKGGGQFQQAAVGDQIYPGTTFVRVVDLSELVVSAQVNQVDAQAVRVGQPAAIWFDAYPDLVLEGRVSRVAAIAGGADSPGSRGGGSLYVKTIPVEVAFETSDPRVIPDLSVAVDVKLSGREAELAALRESSAAGRS
jgi:multidrug resistance efflux pump